MQKVDAEIRRIIDEQYALARKLIEENRDKVEAMAKALLEWETHRRRPDRRHHGRQAAASAEGLDAVAAAKPAAAACRRSTPAAHRRRRLTAATMRSRSNGASAPFVFGRAPCVWQTARFAIDLVAPRVMGIVNVTPDSFSDGGALRRRRRRRIAHCEQLVARGRRHPRHRRRVDAARAPRRCRSTRSSRACCRCCDGARALRRAGLGRHLQARGDARGARRRRRHGQRRRRAARARRARGGGRASDVRRLPDAHAGRAARRCRRRRLRRRGGRGARVPAAASQRAASAPASTRERIVLDPGFGFGKTVEHNLELLRAPARAARALGCPLLVGWSRKSTLGAHHRPRGRRAAGAPAWRRRCSAVAARRAHRARARRARQRSMRWRCGAR